MHGTESTETEPGDLDRIQPGASRAFLVAGVWRPGKCADADGDLERPMTIDARARPENGKGEGVPDWKGTALRTSVQILLAASVLIALLFAPSSF